MVGLATPILRGRGPAKFGAVFENLHLNTYIAGNVIAVGRLFNKPITIGKSMLFRKTTIMNIGGFAAFKDVLAEDHLIGVYIKRLGLSVRLSHYYIDNINVTWSTGRFINRHLRWAKMRRHLNFGHYLIELLSNPIALSSLYFGIHPGLISASILLGISLIKIAADWALARSLHSDLKPVDFLLVPFKDLLLAIIWVVPFFSRHVNWRGNRFRIMNQTVLQSAD
jgi:ceramide glucosyltransferase